ncbi:alpha/beta hydrolase [Nigerium massiliense]|uniref:alpha/beta hydrolase n=1 Tax=Nigerium massiliense TaxID=1522317 RepID=UPI000693B84E|nr:alpha/beta fold hydrolase [Nigerium massiliense]
MSRTLPGRVGVAAALAAGVLVTSGAVTATAATTTSDTTNPVERARVDAVPTPRLSWTACGDLQCAKVSLPRDYDKPRAQSVEVALTRVPARNQARKLGTLFLNPGGPGQSGTEFTARFLQWAGPEITERFDLVGFDPRGVNQSTTTHCFPTEKQQTRALEPLAMLFPVIAQEEVAYTGATDALGHACSTRGKQVVGSVSTAEVARDLDVLRRAVGDEKLTYLGFSYGTYLGQVYANMFPDRVRAVAVDGVIDPTAWVGSDATRSIPVSMRLRSAEGSSKALKTSLALCAKAGDACPLANPQADFDRVAAKLRAKHLVVDDPDGQFTLTYQQFVATVLYSLYSEAGVGEIPGLVAMVDSMQASGPSAAPAIQLSKAYRKTAQDVKEKAKKGGKGPLPYDNQLEVVPAIMCTDSRNPGSSDAWRALAATADARAPYFGRHWLWGSAACAEDTWTVKDEDAYAGPFTRTTSAPVLVVGNHYDPATNYESAVAASRLLPNSTLVSSNNWGHTAYGVSACATAAIDRYLLTGTTTSRSITCSDGQQPFQR